MKDLMGVMKQLGEMQSRMQRMQEELAQMEIDGQAGGGLVKVVLGGKGDLKKLTIDPSLMKPGETEILEDLVVAAAQEAKGKLEAAAAGEDAGYDRRPPPTARHEAVLRGPRRCPLRLGSSRYGDRHEPRCSR